MGCTCLCLCLCGDTVLLSVRICDQYVQTESPDYCQLLPFWANHPVNQPASIQMQQKPAWLVVVLRERGPWAEDDSTDKDPVCISHPSSWPNHRWQRVGQSLMWSLRKTLLPTRGGGLWKHISSLSILFMNGICDKLLFLSVLRRSAYFETDYRRVIDTSSNSSSCGTEPLFLRWSSAPAQKKRNKGPSHDCEAEISTQIQIISQLSTLAGLRQQALLTAPPNVSALVPQIRDWYCHNYYNIISSICYLL